ncbi:MAG TPA: bifunctional phosphoribosyl-AMP cyclohydrolase/phosphoribosyl-ATP diphosphatase HisIE [Polyangiaceae bacterium]|nr:bifunctional phosphoribosyl-AMP cyclohydrolase/phosphoribosyl-ATP diphosphatase HisIE [Polyangiaceae bacterium]
MESIRFDEHGLIPAVAQDRLTGQVRMVAWMNAEALARTLESGRATFFSRSRRSLWQKGETSGNALAVHAVYADCDADTLLLLVDPAGPSCHTGRPTCFFRRVEKSALVDTEHEASAFLASLEDEIRDRQASTATKSYTKSLLDGGAEKIGDKLREEASELSVALASETEERVANEAADVLYHLLVGLRLRDVPLRRVIEVLAKRAGTSGHAEKAGRK